MSTVSPDLEARKAWFDLRQAGRCKDRDDWDASYQGLMGNRVVQMPSPVMAVTVNAIGSGKHVLTLAVSDPTHPRIDAVYEGPGMVGVVQGIPAAVPVPPSVPDGYGVIAHVRVLANAMSITSANIEGAVP